MTKLKELINKLEEKCIAETKDSHPYFTEDDYTAVEYTGSNVDDAFESGMGAGEEQFANTVLNYIEDIKKITSEKTLNLHQKLLEIRKTIPYIQKDAEGYNYKYVKGSILLGLLRPKMDELGVMLSYDIVDMETVDVEREVRKKLVQTARVKQRFLFTWTNVDDPKDEIKKDIMIQGIGDDIQSIGGYHTYAIRYFLLGFFNIPTDDADPDTHENAKNAAQPAEILSNGQLEQLERMLVGHEDIKGRIIQKYKKLYKIKAAHYETIKSATERLIADKQPKEDVK